MIGIAVVVGLVAFIAHANHTTKYQEDLEKEERAAQRDRLKEERARAERLEAEARAHAEKLAAEARAHAEKLAAETRAHAEKLAAEKRAIEQKQRDNARHERQRLFWERLMTNGDVMVFAGGKGEEVVGRVVEVLDDGFILEDGNGGQQKAGFADLNWRRADDPALLQDPTFWIFQPAP